MVRPTLGSGSRAGFKGEAGVPGTGLPSTVGLPANRSHFISH